MENLAFDAHEPDEAQLLEPGFEVDTVGDIPEEDAEIFKVYGEGGRPFVDRGRHPGGRRESDALVGLRSEARKDVAKIYAEISATRTTPEDEVWTFDEPQVYPYVGFDDHKEVKPPKKVRSEHAETKEKEPKFKVREATFADIPAIVDVDMRAFDSVYRDYPENPDELRAELIEKFTGRLEKVGGKWMPVLERDGEIVGVMACCPTSKKPEDFKSWEDTTDNGTLETTYDPKGKNVYVVTLSVLPAGTEAKDRLFVDQMSKMFGLGYESAFFESRLPGLKKWTQRQALGYGMALEYLSPDQLNYFADIYYNLKTEVKGKLVPHDRLLRLYDRVGCKFLKIVPNAYKDEPSLDYGVVCVYDGSEFFDGSVLPIKLPDNKATRKSLSFLMGAVSKSQKLTTKLLG